MTRCADEKTLEIKGATTVLKLGGLSADGASRGAEGVGRGEGVSPPHWERGLGGGRAPSLNFFSFFI